MWSIDLPLKIPCDDRSKPVKHRPGWEQPYFSLNLNQYRNAHHQVLNNAKVNFEILARGLIKQQQIPKLNQVELEYQLFPGTRQICDVNNVLSIVDKFFSDALVSSGVLSDDNYNFIANTRFLFGQIDRENPRVTVTLRTPEPHPLASKPAQESKPMKIASRSTHIVELSLDDLISIARKHLEEELSISIAKDAKVTAYPLSDGGIKLCIEHEASEQPKKRGPKPRLDPATAIQAVNQQLHEKKPEETASNGPGSSSDEPEKDNSPPQNPQSEEASTTTAEASSAEPEKKAEEPPPKPKGPSLFSQFTRPQN